MVRNQDTDKFLSTSYKTAKNLPDRMEIWLTGADLQYRSLGIGEDLGYTVFLKTHAKAQQMLIIKEVVVVEKEEQE